jgi:hypothetical protein
MQIDHDFILWLGLLSHYMIDRYEVNLLEVFNSTQEIKDWWHNYLYHQYRIGAISNEVGDYIWQSCFNE